MDVLREAAQVLIKNHPDQAVKKYHMVTDALGPALHAEFYDGRDERIAAFAVKYAQLLETVIVPDLNAHLERTA